MEEKITKRNLNTHPQARLAIIVWGKEYSEQRGGSMDFWDKLDNSRKRLCIQWIKDLSPDIEISGGEVSLESTLPKDQEEKEERKRLKERSDKIDLLDRYSVFLSEHGYLDEDWRSEEPYAIDEFLKE